MCPSNFSFVVLSLQLKLENPVFFAHVLEVTEKYKYLGVVVFSEKGDFDLNATNMAKGGGHYQKVTKPKRIRN